MWTSFNHFVVTMYHVDRDLIFTEISLPNSILQDDSEV